MKLHWKIIIGIALGLCYAIFISSQSDRFQDLNADQSFNVKDEPFVDSNNNKICDQAEEFTDKNNNGRWDQGEEFSDDKYNTLDHHLRHIIYFSLRSFFSNSLPFFVTKIYLTVGITIISFLFIIITFNDIFYK